MTLTTSLSSRCCLALVAALGLGAIGAARADSGRAMPANMPKPYIEECASCHTAYPAALLPKRSWQRIMSGLDQHFGVNASLDEATARQLASWLQANGGTYKRVTEEPPQDRVTRSAWFVRKHREVEPAVWKHASVKSAANCGACHSRADQGDFDDHNLKAPAGLPARMHRTWNH